MAKQDKANPSSETNTGSQNSQQTDPNNGDAAQASQQGATPNSPSGSDAAGATPSPQSSTAPTPLPDQPNPHANPPSDAASAKGSGAGRSLSAAERRAREREYRAANVQGFAEACSQPDFPLSPGAILAGFANAFARLPAREQFSELRVIFDHYNRNKAEIEAFEARHRAHREAGEDEEDRMADSAKAASAE